LKTAKINLTAERDNLKVEMSSLGKTSEQIDTWLKQVSFISAHFGKLTVGVIVLGIAIGFSAATQLILQFAK
jgi:hypothetical protein